MPRTSLSPTHEGITLGFDKHDDEVRGESFSLARQLTVQLHDLGLSVALDASLGTVNALLAAMAARCERSAPPADIEMTTDSQGDLIYRCKHKSPHTWKV